jgi:hypothetical protein
MEIATEVLDVTERDREWIDSDGLCWRWRDGWQWRYANYEWVTSNRPKIMARGPFKPT